jgi:hypothetical protein
MLTTKVPLRARPGAIGRRRGLRARRRLGSLAWTHGDELRTAVAGLGWLHRRGIGPTRDSPGGAGIRSTRRLTELTRRASVVG